MSKILGIALSFALVVASWDGIAAEHSGGASNAPPPCPPQYGPLARVAPAPIRPETLPEFMWRCGRAEFLGEERPAEYGGWRIQHYVYRFSYRDHPVVVLFDRDGHFLDAPLAPEYLRPFKADE